MLSEQLSVLLVAYTIEYDNEFEQHMPNRTATFGPGGPASAVAPSGVEVKRTWLTSKVMWANFMRYVPPDGVPLRLVRDLPAKLGGLQRWGFISIREPDGARALVGGASAEPGPDALVKATRAGRWAQGIWRRLDEAIDRRWEERFGADLIGELRAALTAIGRPVAAGMPLYLPVVGYGDGMRSRYPDLAERGLPAVDLAARDLSGLLSPVLLAFTTEYESIAKLPLPINANVLRVIADDGARVSDIPLLAGVSREGVTSALGFLERQGYVKVGADPAGRRGKFVQPTERGRRSRDGRAALAARVEAGWQDRFGAQAVGRLRDALGAATASQCAGDSGAAPTLALGLKPYPDGWRSRPPYLAQTKAVLADPAGALPRHPMVLHRGGYPDGS
jgi:DNA-binding MarR family transcriptional regulator